MVFRQSSYIYAVQPQMFTVAQYPIDTEPAVMRASQALVLQFHLLSGFLTDLSSFHSDSPSSFHQFNILSTQSFQQQAATIFIMPSRRRTNPAPNPLGPPIQSQQSQQSEQSEPPEPLEPPKPWSMYPSYHDAVSELLKEDNLFFSFHDEDDSDCEEEYDTNIMGRFRCHNRGCRTRGWASKLIAITIRMYPGQGYNARVYHQRCRACNELSKPMLNESYIERVVYRLKWWSGVQMERPPYSGQQGQPHKSDLCEGCRHGHCKG